MAIYYKEWGKHLRWGNFGMLYMGISSIAKQSGHEFYLPENYFAWKYLENPPKFEKGDEVCEIFHTPYGEYTKEAKEAAVKFLSENKEKNFNVNLGSNLQSESWWIEDNEYINFLMKIKKEELDKVKNKYSNFFNKKTIAIGIRRGDFVGHGVFYQISLDWYLKALVEEFPSWKDYNIIFLSDNIEEIKSIFKGDNFFFAEPNGTHSHKNGFKDYHKDPMEQYILGILCDNMIGGNSTFSWLQMREIHQKGGKVVHSGKNLSKTGEQQFGKNKYYYPESWTLNEIKKGA